MNMPKRACAPPGHARVLLRGGLCVLDGGDGVGRRGGSVERAALHLRATGCGDNEDGGDGEQTSQLQGNPPDRCVRRRDCKGLALL